MDAKPDTTNEPKYSQTKLQAECEAGLHHSDAYWKAWVESNVDPMCRRFTTRLPDNKDA